MTPLTKWHKCCTTLSLLLFVCLLLCFCLTAKPTTGTSFIISIPRTGDDFDGLVRLTAQEEANVVIETATESREVVVPAMSEITEAFPMAQRVTFGLEAKGLMITSDNPISVHIDQPSWELDVAMARPLAAEDTEFYIINYLGDSVTASFWPLSFYSVAASEDNTIVEIFDEERQRRTTVELNTLDVYSEDASELGGVPGSLVDYTGLYISADKPISVFAGHGRVLFPGNNNNQYIYDSVPNTAEIGTSYTTFPIGFGADDTGYMLRVVSTVDGTLVTMPDLDVSETVDAGDYYQIEYTTSYNAFKVSATLIQESGVVLLSLSKLRPLSFLVNAWTIL